MALFQVTRYFGDDTDSDGPKVEASDILKRLQEQAEAKRRSLGKDHKKANEAATPVSVENEDHEKHEKETPSKKRKRSHVVSLDPEIDHVDIKLEDSLVDVTLDPAINHVDIKPEDSFVESDSFVEGKKRKKKKGRHSENKGTNESPVESETGSNEKKIKLEEHIAETCDIDDETRPSKKHLKHKKNKHKETSDADEQTQNSNQKTKSVEIDSNDEGFDSMVNEESDKEAKNATDDNKDSNTNEIGGFTILGSVRAAKLEKVHRVLPEWLSRPSIIPADLDSDKLPITEMPGLAADLVEKLRENNITHFFPVQSKVIPALLESSLTGFQTGRAGYRPSDTCVSAPTGSGKTLAFVLPIVQALRSRVTCEVRALAVLPVRDLATQVFKVFQTYCKGFKLKVGLMIGQKTFLAEQQSLVKKRLKGYQNVFDIIVATPGRLVDHINKTEGFNLGHLRYLVIDEADRMMDEIKQDWLIQVENSVYRSRPQPGPLTATNCMKMEMPLQKLLYSATLSQNPEKLQQLNLFQPKLFTSVVKTHAKATSAHHTVPEAEESIKSEPVWEEETMQVDRNDIESNQGSDSKLKQDTTAVAQLVKSPSKKPVEKAGDYVGKYATPSSLSEHIIETTAAQKPLIILHMLLNLNFRSVLCFTNSVDATHRLCTLLKLYGGIQVKEFSSNLHVARRNDIIQKFLAGKIDIIVCSDAMARGMDISNVKYVISYDPPPYIQTYIHRIGRTARAGKDGSAFTLLQQKEFFHFKKMVREAGKASPSPMKISKAELKPLLPKYEETLKQLGDVLKNERPKKRYTPRKLQKPEIKNNTG